MGQICLTDAPCPGMTDSRNRGICQVNMEKIGHGANRICKI